MKTLIIIVAVVAVLSSSTASEKKTQLVDYRLKLWQNKSATFADEPCQEEGLMCKNCRETAYCQWNGNAFDQLPGSKCPIGHTCKGSKCFPGEDPSCPPTTGAEFPCSTNGIFPDPGDCTKYHICAMNPTTKAFEHFDYNCDNVDNWPNKYRYNAKTFFCDQKLTAKGCTGYPIPLCKKEYESAPLRENPSIYYTCIPHFQDGFIYPYQIACENGRRYSATTGDCK